MYAYDVFVCYIFWFSTSIKNIIFQLELNGRKTENIVNRSLCVCVCLRCNHYANIKCASEQNTQCEYHNVAIFDWIKMYEMMFLCSYFCSVLCCTVAVTADSDVDNNDNVR